MFPLPVGEWSKSRAAGSYITRGQAGNTACTLLAEIELPQHESSSTRPWGVGSHPKAVRMTPKLGMHQLRPRFQREPQISGVALNEGDPHARTSGRQSVHMLRLHQARGQQPEAAG